MPPLRVIISKKHEGCKGKFAIVSSDTNRLLGCHPTKASAINQMQAIYAQQASKK